MQRTLLGPLCRCRAFFPRKLRTGPLCRRNADSRLGTASKILGGRLYPQIQDGKDRCAHPRYLGALQMGKESAVRRQFHNGAWLGPYAWLALSSYRPKRSSLLPNLGRSTLHTGKGCHLSFLIPERVCLTARRIPSLLTVKGRGRRRYIPSA